MGVKIYSGRSFGVWPVLCFLTWGKMVFSLEWGNYGAKIGLDHRLIKIWAPFEGGSLSTLSLFHVLSNPHLPLRTAKKKKLFFIDLICFNIWRIYFIISLLVMFFLIIPLPFCVFLLSLFIGMFYPCLQPYTVTVQLYCFCLQFSERLAFFFVYIRFTF